MPKIASARYEADSPSKARKSDGLSAIARLKAVDGPFASGARALAPEVPSLAHELVRPRHLQRVAELRPMHDPAAVLAELPPHLGEGDVDRVARDVRALPCLRNHRVVVDDRALMLEQHPQRLERARPQPHLGAVARQPGRGGAQAKGSEGEFRHRHTVSGRERQSPQDRPSADVGIDSLDPGCYDPRLDAVRYTQRVLHAQVPRARASGKAARWRMRGGVDGHGTLSAGTPRWRSLSNRLGRHRRRSRGEQEWYPVTGAAFGMNGKPTHDTPTIQSLDRGLAILEAVAASAEPVPLKQLTDLIGIDAAASSGWRTRCVSAGSWPIRKAARTTFSGPSAWRLSRRYGRSVLGDVLPSASARAGDEAGRDVALRGPARAVRRSSSTITRRWARWSP